MAELPKYEVLQQFSDSNELRTALQEGNIKDKQHALLNIAYGNGDGEITLNLFVHYINDPELRLSCYFCIDKFLEISRDYPLLKILPIIIAGLDNEDEFIRSNCQDAIGNLISPAMMTEKSLDFNSFQIQFDNNLLPEYLNSFDAEKIIIGLLYTFHHSHKNEQLFELLKEQLAKKIKAVTYIIGKIINEKLYNIIEQIDGLEDISLTYYKSETGLNNQKNWIFDRFDRIQMLAKQQMETFKPNTDN